MQSEIWAIEIECADPYYGWHVEELFEHREDAKDRMEFLANLNKGCRYQVREWEVTTAAMVADPIERKAVENARRQKNMKIVDKQLAYNPMFCDLCGAESDTLFLLDAPVFTDSKYICPTCDTKVRS